MEAIPLIVVPLVIWACWSYRSQCEQSDRRAASESKSRYEALMEKHDEKIQDELLRRDEDRHRNMQESREMLYRAEMRFPE